ncbi:MAG: hypothetical protein ACM3PP_05770 [Candidatus Saccharibacteria bacterium]
MNHGVSRTLRVGDEEHGITVTLRPMVADEAGKVYKMVKQAFGDVFGYYTDEEIIKLNQDGTLFSLVAVTEGGDLAGHVDLEFFKSSNLALMDNACVQEKYGHTHIVFELSKMIIDHAREANVNGALTLSLTNHTITQRMANYFGSDCGILLGSVPIKDPADKQLQQRYVDSAVINYIPLKTRDALELYLPAHHRALIEEIYSTIGYPIISCKTDESIQLAAPGMIDVMPDNMGIVFFNVVSYGNDTLDQIESKLEYLFSREEQSSAYLFLNLEDPLTPQYVGLFEEKGFFFSGILPYGGRGHDVIVLQYLNSKIEPDRIKLYSPIAKEILAHIRSVKSI